MRQDQDRSIKRERLLAVLRRHGLESLQLTSTPALHWYLGGARTQVSLAAGPILSVTVRPDHDEVWLSDNEAGRMCAEELPGDLDVRLRRWYEPAPAPVGTTEANLPADLTDELTDELWRARWPLLPGETARFRSLGTDAATLMTAALSSARPDWTEQQLAAEIGRAVIAVGAEPLVVLVGGHTRAAFPHPLSTRQPLGRRALAVLCARRHGLVVNLSRIVAFESPTADELAAQRAIFAVEQAAFEATTPGRRLGDVLDVIAAAYPRAGFGPDHWRGHHQGGMAGYDGRDPRATPGAKHPIAVGQAFAWNPWAPGVKVEDTVLLTDSGLETLSSDPAWPTVQIGGRARPDVLVR